MKPAITSVVQFVSKLLVSVIGFVATFVFARELGSSILGTYFLIVAVLSWLEFVGRLGISSAIRKRVSEREAADEFLSAGIVLQAVVLVVLVGATLVVRPYLNDYLGAEVGWIVALMLALKLSFSVMEAGLRGQHRVTTAAILDLGSQLFRATFQIALVLLGFGLLGLLAGYTVAFALATVGGVLLVLSRYVPVRPRTEHFYQLFEFARYSWLGTLKTRTSAWTDTVVLGFFVAPSLIGVYEVSWNIATVLALASQSISSALFPTMSESATMDQTETVRDLLEQSLVYAGFVAIPGAVGAVLLAPELLRFYGSEFTKGGVILAILGVFAIFSSYEGQLHNGLNALDRPDLSFRANCLFIAANLTGNVVLITFFGWVGAAVATTLSMFISLAYTFSVLRNVISPTVPYRELLYQIGSAGLMGVVVVGARPLTSGHPYYYVLVLVAIGIVVYFAGLLTLSSRIRARLVSLVKTSTGEILGIFE
ncbi:transporter [Halobacteriales archaeon QS_1_68_17]|nr:MAG: transporter [Halobacteriales archaeon QS_1_68_17]